MITPVVLSESVLPTPLGLSDSVLTTQYSVLATAVQSVSVSVFATTVASVPVSVLTTPCSVSTVSMSSVPSSTFVSHARSLQTTLDKEGAMAANNEKLQSGVRCWINRESKKKERQPKESKKHKESIVFLKQQVPKTRPRNEYASPKSRSRNNNACQHFSGGLPKKDSVSRSQQQCATEKETSKNPKNASISKSQVFRSVQGSRCWRSRRTTAATTRRAGVWEHKDGKIVPTSWSGCNSLKITERATYPSRRRWIR